MKKKKIFNAIVVLQLSTEYVERAHNEKSKD